MNWDEVKGQWKQLTGKAKQQWADLTDDDLARIHGDRTLLEGKIQERYGATKEEAKRRVDKWLEAL